LASSRSLNFWIFPVEVFGNSANTTKRGQARATAEMKLRTARAEGLRGIVTRQITEIEAQIDKLAYEVFEFTPEEVEEVKRETVE
jgi:hypothetical protein